MMREVALADAGAASASSRNGSMARDAAFDVEIVADFEAAMAIVGSDADVAPATPFQGPAWLGAWRRAFCAKDARASFIAIARCRASGRLALALPLAIERRGRLTIVGAMDGGVTDYNAPILGPAAPSDAAGAQSLWRSLSAALPPCDLIEVTKSPRTLNGRANPLALIAAARASTLAGNILAIDTPFDAFVRGFERKFRKELGREKRVFEAIEGARFEIIKDVARALEIHDALAAMQSARIQALGRSYVLDEPEPAAFYRELIRIGLTDGRVVLSALFVGDTLVAALLGIVGGDHYAMVRLGQAGAPWTHFSPGRLVIMETMRALREKGFRRFDFTIGDYDYKRRLGVVAQPLVDISAAMSWRGWPVVARQRARVWARQSGLARRAVSVVRKLMQRV